MAYKRISAITFLADYVSDLKELPRSQMGTECHIIENASQYKCNSAGEWILQTISTCDADLSNYYTKNEVDRQIVDKVEDIVDENVIDSIEAILEESILSSEEILEICKS